MKKTQMGMLLMTLACHTHGGDFSIKLISPPDRILHKEYKVDIRVAISNGTDSAIRLLGGAGSVANNEQLFFTASDDAIMNYCRHFGLFKEPRTNAWGRINSTNQWDVKQTKVLAPGQTYEWDCEYLIQVHELAGQITSGATQFDLYAQVLVGTNQWAYSNTNTVKFSWVKVEDGMLLHTGMYPRATDGTLQPFHVYEHTIDGDRFLFCKESGRICKLGNGVVPSFEVEAGTNILKVTFSDNSPPIRFVIPWGNVIP